MLEIGKFQANESWVDVDYAIDFAAPPILLAASQTFNEADPFVTKVATRESAGFRMRLLEGRSLDREEVHQLESVGYIAFANGDIISDQGKKIGECGSFIAKTPNRQAWNFVQLQDAFENPVVIATIVSDNGPKSGLSRLRNISSDSFEYQLQEWSYQDGKHFDETIHYVVIEAGNHLLADGTQLSAGMVETENEDPALVNLPRLTENSVVLHQVQTNNSAQAVITRLHDRYDDGFTLLKQEEEASLGFHDSETIGYVVAIPVNVATSELQDAARFLTQSTFGATKAEMIQVAQNGYDDWFAEQAVQPLSLTTPYMDRMYDLSQTLQPLQGNAQGGLFPDSNIPWYNFNGRRAPAGNIGTAWMRNVVNMDDRLRQRMTWALSNIFVVSYVGDNQTTRRAGQLVTSFYDMLSENAFGNFLDLLLGISLHPMMANYLSYLGNEKPDPSINRTPDENYAREVMQLFSIGLWELNRDGTQKLDAENQPIPTYDNDVIAELSRVFTGFWITGKEWQQGYNPSSYLRGIELLEGLEMFEDRHDTDEKVLFRNKPWQATLAAGTDGLTDIYNALVVLYNHPNTPPFISKALIKLLVTSNPSPAYVDRVAQAFEDNGQGVRGDMLAVYKAILLDAEAREPEVGIESYGRLKEPMLRVSTLVRAFKAGKDLPYEDVENGLQFWAVAPESEFFQMPMASPSVFNFFSPTYQHHGQLRDSGLDSPEFQILNPISATATPNRFAEMIDSLIHTHSMPGGNNGSPFTFDFSTELALANDTNALIEHLNLLLCQGQMTEWTRQLLEQGINEFEPDQVEDKVKFAVWFVAVSPDGAVQY